LMNRPRATTDVLSVRESEVMKLACVRSPALWCAGSSTRTNSLGSVPGKGTWYSSARAELMNEVREESTDPIPKVGSQRWCLRNSSVSRYICEASSDENSG